MEKFKTIKNKIYDRNPGSSKSNVIDVEGKEVILNKITGEKFNEFGNITDEITYNLDGSISSIRHNNYNQEQKIISWDISPWRSIFEYDKNNNLISQKFYRDDKLDRTTNYKYNDKGNVIREDSDVRNNIMYEYDINQNLFKKSIILENGVIYKESYFDKGKISTEKSFQVKTGELLSVKDFHYNEFGLLAFQREATTDRNDDLKIIEESIKYEYDKNNNWIKRINLKSQFGEEILIIREIEYYF